MKVMMKQSLVGTPIPVTVYDCRLGDRGVILDLETEKPVELPYGDFKLEFNQNAELPDWGTLTRIKISSAYQMWQRHPERFSKQPPLIEAKLNPATGKTEPVYETIWGQFKFIPAKG